MKRICLVFILIFAAAQLSAQSVWTGNAAVSSEKEFESYYSEDSSTGRYLGASNSFPGSTEVTITNPRNGKTVSVSIVKRLSQPGLFLVLSPEAGEAIELPDDDILNVEVVVKRKNEEIFSSYSDDRPYSEDPDLNPSAELSAESPVDSSSSDTDIVSTTAVVEEAEPEIEPPVETGVNEFIPPVVLDSEGLAYEEGYDPLVVLEDTEESSEPGEVVEIIDDPLVLAQTITGSVSEPEIPLPETYDSTDLPDSYEPELVEDTVINTSPEVVGITPESDKYSNTLDDRIVLAEPELLDSELVESGIIEPENLDSEFMDADIDDLLISEPAVKEPELEDVIISDIVISEPELDESEFEAPVIDEPEPVVIEPVVEEIIVAKPEIEAEPLEIEPVVEEVVVAEPEPEPENVIYFLTPGDFRPPPQSEEKEKEKEKEKIKEKTIVALPVERSELESMIVTELRNGGSYLQLGTYGSVDVLYDQIEQIDDFYPSIVLTMGNEENRLYKLLIGPISRDEKGIIMTRFRSLGYLDAFLYSPR